VTRWLARNREASSLPRHGAGRCACPDGHASRNR